MTAIRVKRKNLPITLKLERVNYLLGTDFAYPAMKQALTAVGCQLCDKGADFIEAVVPWWRQDLNLPEDLIEEIARIIGYDKIPTTLLGEPIPYQNPQPLVTLKRRLRQFMVGAGFQETVNYSQVSYDVMGGAGAGGTG